MGGILNGDVADSICENTHKDDDEDDNNAVLAKNDRTDFFRMYACWFLACKHAGFQTLAGKGQLL